MHAIVLQTLHRSTTKQNYALQLAKDVGDKMLEDITFTVGGATQAFRKLHKDGLVKRTAEDGLRGKPRAIYTLTKKGKQVAVDQLRIIKSLIGKD